MSLESVWGQSILPRSLYSGSGPISTERDEAADTSLLLAAEGYPHTQNVSLSLGLWPATAESRPSPNNCLRTSTRLSLCIYKYIHRSVCSQLCVLIPGMNYNNTASLQGGQLNQLTCSPAQVQFRWSQCLVMTGNWWQTWDVELSPEGSSHTFIPTLAWLTVSPFKCLRCV